MDEKESTVSGSPRNSESDSASPAVTSTAVPVPQAMNINKNMDEAAENKATERSNNVSSTAATGSGGGGLGGQRQGSGSVDLFGKKKRGRPRRYDADGNLRVKLNPLPFQFQQTMSGGGGVLTQSPPSAFSFSLSSPPSEQFLSFTSSSSTTSKRGRGRPPGSGNWQLLASLGELFANTAGGDFTPHVVTVNTGEDVAGKIVSLSQKGPRGICILSANGAVSNVTIRQPGSSGGILTYEGRFEILSLSGSFTVTEAGGVRSRTGGLSVSLAGPDGRVIGGGVAGLLLAASPIQIVVGSFMPNGYKTHKKKHYRERSVASVVPSAADVVTAARPITEAKPAGQACVTPPTSLVDKDDPSSCLAVSGQRHEGADNVGTDKQMPNANNSNIAGCWNRTDQTSSQRPSPDINVSAPSEDDIQDMCMS